MHVTVHPGLLSGTVTPPPSKSQAHRLVLAASLADGLSVIRNLAPSRDVSATVSCMTALGAKVDWSDRSAEIRGTGPEGGPLPELFCGESGSTLRFLIPVALALRGGGVFRGKGRLMQRPLEPYFEIFREKGIAFSKNDDTLTVQGCLTPGTYRLPGDVSSQFITGLLFALPGLCGESRIVLSSPLESAGYIDMTLDALRRFGVETAWEGAARIRIPGGQRYLPQDIRVEGDWSNAAFFLALGVPVTGLAADSLQGDRVCVEYFRALDQGPAELSLADCPDLGPVLFAYAALHHGGTFTDTRRLRIKESDRGAAMQEELRKFGIRMEVLDNRISVGSGVRPPQEPLYGHNDHRIVMALAVLCVKIGGTICGAQAVRKSFPDFFRRLRNLGIRAEETEP